MTYEQHHSAMSLMFYHLTSILCINQDSYLDIYVILNIFIELNGFCANMDKDKFTDNVSTESVHIFI